MGRSVWPGRRHFRHGRKNSRGQRKQPAFGVRRQSAAAMALLRASRPLRKPRPPARPPNPKRRGASLPAALQNAGVTTRCPLRNRRESATCRS
jgi:hypothetical protein